MTPTSGHRRSEQHGGADNADELRAGAPARHERYERNIPALTADQCALLRGKTVLVAGLGGLGGFVLELLARVGVGTLVAVDCDAFAPTNLNRQLLATEATIGQRKADVARERVAMVNPDVAVVARDERIDESTVDDLVQQADCVVDALDNAPTRALLGRACRAVGIPIVYGGISEWHGIVSTVLPDDASYDVLYGTLADMRGGIPKSVLPFAAAATASFQAAEAVKVLLGAPDTLRNCLLMIDLKDATVERIELAD